MKRVLWMAMLMLALPMAAFASSFDFSTGTFSSGTMTGSFSTSLNISITGSLNTITVMTGALSAPVSCGTGCSSFTFTGGSVAVGPGGSVFSDNLLSGTLVEQVGAHGDSLAIAALLSPSGSVENGTGTVSLDFKVTATGFKVNAGSIDVSGHSPVVPEPGSLSLLGTGLIGIAGLVRRKLKA